MIGAVAFSTVAVLWLSDPKGFELMKALVNSITGSTFSFKDTSPERIFLYGFVVFILINAAILLTSILIFIFTLGKLDKVLRFYRISIWFLVSAVVFTGVLVYGPIRALTNGAAFADVIKSIHWTSYVPIGSSVVLAILGLIFYKTERN